MTPKPTAWNNNLLWSLWSHTVLFLRLESQKWRSSMVWAHVLASNVMAVELSARAAAIGRLPWAWKTPFSDGSFTRLQEAQVSFLCIWAPVQGCLTIPVAAGFPERVTGFPLKRLWKVFRFHADSQMRNVCMTCLKFRSCFSVSVPSCLWNNFHFNTKS